MVKKIILSMICSTFCFIYTGFSQDLLETKNKLLASIRSADAKIINIQTELQQINETLLPLNQEIDLLSTTKQELESKIIFQQADLAELQKNIELSEQQITATIKLLILYDRSIQQKVYLNRKFFENYYRNSHIIKVIEQRTKEELQQLRKNREASQNIIKELNENLASVNINSEKLAAAQKKLNEELQRKLLLVKLLNDEKKEFIQQATLISQQLADNRDNAQQNQNNNSNTNSKQSASDLKALQASLQVPTTGNIIQQFGAKHKGDIKTYAQGVLLAIPQNNNFIKAITKGKVLQISKLPNNLQAISIDHGQNLISFYGLLTKVLVTPGEQVQAGQNIAEINDNNIIGGKIFYFELRHQLKAVNPKQWIPNNAW